MRQPALFLPHGGGPCFFLNPDGSCPTEWLAMRDFLAGVIASLPQRPSAILLVSGHWIEPHFTVHTGAHPELLFDYYGFPDHTYGLKWPAPGAPDVALRAAELLRDADFSTDTQSERGWDHGVFIPLMVAVPDANIPVAQLSLLGAGPGADFNAAAHIAAGRALAPMRNENVLIIGSGMSFHNMRLLGGVSAHPASVEFDAALSTVVTDPDPVRRNEHLAHWSTLASARVAHPPQGGEDHLIPLMVAAGAAEQDPGQHIFRDQVVGWTVSGYRFG